MNWYYFTPHNNKYWIFFFLIGHTLFISFLINPFNFSPFSRTCTSPWTWWHHHHLHLLQRTNLLLLLNITIFNINFNKNNNFLHQSSKTFSTKPKSFSFLVAPLRSSFKTIMDLVLFSLSVRVSSFFILIQFNF